MRALAEYIMRGRRQAALVAFCGNLLPLISPAAVGLVTLRKGLSEGLLVMLWAQLPLVLALYTGSLSPMIVLASIAGLMMVPVASEILKMSVSWGQTLVFVVALSGVITGLLNIVFADQAQLLEEAVAAVFAQVQEQAQQTQDAAIVPGRPFVLGVVGYLIALTVIASLVLGRWWQAMLYNPGGFQLEFHQLRLGAWQAAVLLFAVVACHFWSQDYASWAGLLGLPLLLCGISLVHHTVASYQLGGHWLVLFYIGLLMISPMSMMLVGIAFLDSIVNIRSRLARRP